MSVKLRTSSMKVGRVIHKEISDIAPTYAIVAENTAKFPFITWRRLSLQCYDTKDRFNVLEKATMEITIAAATYAQSLELAQAVKVRLDKLGGIDYETETEEAIHIDDIRMVNATEDYVGSGNSSAYIQTLTFVIDIAKECC